MCTIVGMSVEPVAAATCMAGPTEHGKRCGAPAVVAHTLSTGQTFAQCSEHALASARRAAAIWPGARVRVSHTGTVKTGRVVSVGHGRVRVAVPHAGAVTIVERALSEIERVSPPSSR